ncbi:MAG TPA: hypothetical protein VK817_24340 [Trebonia sp.]|nr:hypothetical protein [Trebonia sp.]
MSKRKKIASIAFTGAAAAAVVGMQVGPAAAATAWTINEPNGTDFTGTNTSPAILNAGGINLTCPDGTAVATGSTSGNGKTTVPAQLAKIKTATFGTTAAPCSLLGFGVTATLKKSIGLTGTAATTTAGVTVGTLGVGSVTTNDISATVTGVGAFKCTMVVSGTTIAGSYHNTGNALSVNPKAAATLKIKSVTGCSSLFTKGETAYFKAKYATTPKLTISGG